VDFVVVSGVASTSKAVQPMTSKRWVLVGGAVVIVFVIWTVVSLHDDDSTVSVVVRAVRQRMCWPADSSTFCVLRAMEKAEKKDRFDDAIKTGTAWAEKYPQTPANEWVYRDLSVLYLKKASIERQRTEEYVSRAIFYRDKALSLTSDSPYALQPFVAISEAAGDLSTAQRCLHYGNSLKLLTRMQVLANDEKDRLSRQFRPDLAERKQINSLSDWIDAAIKRVTAKASASASSCHDTHTG
jgi:hypothetical protein